MLYLNPGLFFSCYLSWELRRRMVQKIITFGIYEELKRFHNRIRILASQNHQHFSLIQLEDEGKDKLRHWLRMKR